MTNPSSWISHVEAFIDDSRPSKEKSLSLDAIAALVKKDLLTLQALVREMELYLTSSDHAIRARGIVLLAEILNSLQSKSLDVSTISSLAEFLTARLADWQALRGALIGCLALLRRKKNAGVVAGSDARTLAQSFFKNVQVQSLAVHDRKLCFELLQCLLNVYPQSIMTLGDDLVYGICDAIDEEKDPHCLMLTFHLVESLVRIFPQSCVSAADVADDLFEILGRYFPVYFTHPTGDDLNITRDELSTALMHAFCSTPYFEPFAIPLLLEKLSSSLSLAKLDSLRYLNNCIVHYGADRMKKHAKHIWSALKDAIFTFSTCGLVFSSTRDCVRGMESQEDQIAKEALVCLRTALLELNNNSNSFLSFIIEDEDIEKTFNFVSGERCYPVNSKESERQLSALGSILSVSSKASSDSCDKVFQKFFVPLMDILGVPPCSSIEDFIHSDKPTPKAVNSGAICLCVELLASCRDFAVSAQSFPQQLMSLQDGWFYLLKSYAGQLTYSLGSVVVTTGISRVTKEENRQDVVGYAVKGLQVLATFPECCSPISENVYKDILVILMQLIIDSSSDLLLWNSSLKALVQVGLFIDKFDDSWKAVSYSKFVVEKVLSLLPLDDSSVHLAQKLEAVTEIGMTKRDFMLAVTRGLEQAIFSELLEACVHGKHRSAEILICLLKTYSHQVLPWCQKTGSFKEVAVPFAIRIWKEMGDTVHLDVKLYRQDVLDALMMAMKLVVSGCTEEDQTLIVQEGYSVLLSSRPFCFAKESISFSMSNLERSEISLDSVGLSCKDEWLISLFCSVLIAVLPQTPIPDIKLILKLLMVFLLKGQMPAAQALASLINKWPEKVNEREGSNAYSLEEVIELIFEMDLSCIFHRSDFRKFEDLISNMGNCCWYLQHENDAFLINAMDGLAWIGKGLLMRGHGKIKEITMFFLKFLLLNPEQSSTGTHPNEPTGLSGQDRCSFITRSATDAFHVLLSDSELCLNKVFHATIKPLYKQQFFSSTMTILLSSIKASDSLTTRILLCRVFGHVISETPLAAVIDQANKVLPALLETLSLLSPDKLNKDLIYSLLLVVSGVLMDDGGAGKEAVMHDVHSIIGHLIRLVSYPHKMIVRETALQCLVAMSGLPHARIYPMRIQVLRAVSNALDDNKRAVRQEAVRCRQTWASIASRTLHF